MFSYKKDVCKSIWYFNTFDLEDANPRYFVDLRTATVTRGKRANGDRYIEIQDRNDEIVQVAFEDPEEFKKWGIVFVESLKSDEILR